VPAPAMAEKPASIAGPVAFDLAEVGHRGSRQLVFQGSSAYHCRGCQRAFCTWVTLAQINDPMERPATRLQRRRQVQ